MTIEMLETKNPMKRMSAAKFESQCLALIDQIAKTGKPILITKRGRPLVRIEPVQRDDEIFGYMAGKVKILGDIVGPIIPLADWNMAGSTEDRGSRKQIPDPRTPKG
jgi:antitoxin (DNA-binding transcriptional repressor) of toxin-antitoxin stability system